MTRHLYEEALERLLECATADELEARRCGTWNES